jgi:hypothetical protein
LPFWPVRTVYKLHGSYWRYNGRNRVKAKKTIQATLDRITARTREMLLPPTKLAFLYRATLNRISIVPLLIVKLPLPAISGSDDLDIMPSFLPLNVNL